MNGYERIKQLKSDHGSVSRVVVAIFNDFTDRRGLRQEFDQIDDETQVEIINAWIELVRKELVNP